MKIDLIVPGLLLHADVFSSMQLAQSPPLARSLEHLLAHADSHFSTSSATQGISHWLQARWDIPVFPLADTTAHADGLHKPHGNSWLRADPVHLRIQRDNVQLLDTAVLDIQADEAAALVTTLNQHFAADGLVFHAPVPQRWYVSVAENESPVTRPLHEVAGKSLFDYQPVSRGKINWKALANEIQMLLHAHPLNQTREATGKPVINGVWFWGEQQEDIKIHPKLQPEISGMPVSIIGLPWDRLYTDEPYLLGLAKITGTATTPTTTPTTTPVPASFDQINSGQESNLVYLDALDLPARRNDPAKWQAALAALETAWFQPLHQALTGRNSERKIDMLQLHLPSDCGMLSLILTPRSHWKFWRKVKPLAHWIERYSVERYSVERYGVERHGIERYAVKPNGGHDA